ncbi:MAG: 50S ribosomal protein L30 [Rhizobacter sp.]|nr:50S ribosomal protein L30 [Chlorobiales bacterium]
MAETQEKKKAEKKAAAKTEKPVKAATVKSTVAKAANAKVGKGKVAAANSGKRIKITQYRSVIGATASQKATIKAMGLWRPNYHVTLTDSPNLRGQLRLVRHLVKIEDAQ